MRFEFGTVEEFIPAFNAGVRAVRAGERNRAQLELWLMFVRIEQKAFETWQERALLETADDPAGEATLDSPDEWKPFRSYWRAIQERQRRDGAPRQERLHMELTKRLKVRRAVDAVDPVNGRRVAATT